MVDGVRGARVNLVCGELLRRPTHVLMRQALQLATHNGWALREAPDEAAEVNVYWPYLQIERWPSWEATPTAAYFTHREETRPAKAATWERAARAVGMRCTAAARYAQALRGHGPTALVTPGLDRDKFTIKPRRGRRRRPRVGVAGFVYEGGRKGEDLVAAAVASEVGRRCEWLGAGAGWPGVRTVLWPWEELEGFYGGLDVLLCPSRVEGIGYPVLEALACGVKVVVPRDVGVFDELPEIDGIERYAVGEVDGMLAALERALAARVDPGLLREVTARFTPEAWAAGWRVAVERLLGRHEAVLEEAASVEWRGRAGFYVVAYGDPARECARRLLDSVAQHMPEVPVALVSDRRLGGEQVFVEASDSDVGARRRKVQIDRLAPEAWEFVCYLDADTELVAPVPYLFDVLADGWDLVIAINPARYHLIRNMLRPDNRDECEATWAQLGSDELLQLQGGVFAYRRNARTRAFFEAWEEEWERWGKRDQAALLRALDRAKVRAWVVGTEWNASTRYTPRERSAGIVHYQMEARRHTGVIAGRNDSEDAWALVRDGRGGRG